jgi:hypothetical protein
VQRQGRLPDTSGASHYDQRRRTPPGAGTPTPRIHAGEARQRSKLRLAVDEDPDIRGQLARDNPWTTLGSVEVYAARHVTRLYHVAPDRGILDLASRLARITPWYFFQGY